MTKYQKPSDLISLITSLRSRIEKLERISRPSTTAVSLPIVASVFTAPASVNSDTFITTHYFPSLFVSHSPIVWIKASCSDGATGGSFRLADENGVALTDRGGNTAAENIIPIGTTDPVVFRNDADRYWDDYPIGTPRIISLQVRRSAGTGNVLVQPLFLNQVPS